MKRIAWYTAIVLFTLTGVFVLWQFRTPILLFILSLAVAAILRPVVNLLAARGIPRGLALAITYLAVVGIIVALGIFLVGPLIDEMQALVADLPGRYSQTQTQWSNGSGLQQLMAAILPDIDNFSEIITGGKWELFIQNLMEMTLGSLVVLSHILLVFVLSIYWSADEEHFKRLWLSLLPLDQRTRWRDIWQNIEKEIGGYLRSEFFQSLLTVIILGIGYQLIGLQYPVLFAIFAAISWLIVWFGGVAAVILALLAGLSISAARSGGCLDHCRSGFP
ncbi:MAG TPA: AI-2E family transporter [Anaerolinea sp.]|nr:AI-2E family transporter [Anaerolinea sp.]